MNQHESMIEGLGHAFSNPEHQHLGKVGVQRKMIDKMNL
jgi:hypothetical protein